KCLGPEVDPLNARLGEATASAVQVCVALFESRDDLLQCGVGEGAVGYRDRNLVGLRNVAQLAEPLNDPHVRRDVVLFESLGDPVLQCGEDFADRCRGKWGELWAGYLMSVLHIGAGDAPR